MANEIAKASWLIPQAYVPNGQSWWASIPNISSSAQCIWNDTFSDSSSSDTNYVIFRSKTPFIEIQNLYFDATENSANGASIGLIDSSGLTNPTLIITAGNGDPDQDGNPAFAIDGATGQITVNDSGDLDFENTPQFTLTVVAEQADGKSLTNTVQISLTNVDEPGNELPTATDASFTLDENAANGAEVGQVLATDIDAGDKLVYAIAAGNLDPDGDGKAAFAVNPDTGIITVNDSGDLDYETTQNFDLTVTAADTSGLSDDATVKIALNNLNDPVQWKVSEGGNGHFYQAVSLAQFIPWEQAKSAAIALGGHLATITSSAENSFINSLFDSPSDTWWIGGFQPANSPEPSGNWQWVTGESFPYSNWNTGEPNNGLGGGEDAIQYYGNGFWNDLNRDNTGYTGGYILEIENIPYAFSLPENSADATLVGTIAKSGLPDPVFTIAAGNEDPDQDGNPAFAIDSATGAITVNDSGDLDFEAMPQFTLTVVAEEADGKSLTNTAQIGITNVDEPGNEKPTATDASFTLDENAANGTELGQVVATDIDVGDTLAYSISAGNLDPDGDGKAAFAINPDTGAITVNDSGDLDYETTQEFNLTATATDTGGLSDEATVKIALNNLDDPVQWKVSDGGNGHFYQAILVSGGISWDGAKAAAEVAGGHLATIGSGEEDAFIFKLIGTHSAFWNGGLGPWLGGFQSSGAPEPAGGWQWVTGEQFKYSNWDIGQPDNTYQWSGYENYLHFFNNEDAWNDLSNSYYPNPYCYVLEIENIPYAFSLPENSPDATLVGTIAKSGLADPVFTIAAGNEDPDQDGNRAFAIDSATGAITVNDSGDLDFESTPQFTLTVVAEEADGKSLTNSVQISLTNVDEPGNEQPEVQDGSLAIVERPLKDTLVGAIAASDIDTGDKLAYAIVSGNTDVNGNGQAAFAVDAATGQIAVNDPDDLDYETQPVFTLGVAATDTGGLSGHGTVTVQLADLNEIQGTAGPESLRGTAGNDRLDGADDNDTLKGKAGDDLLIGGAGTDSVHEQGDVDFTLTDAQLTGLGTDTLSSIERAELVGGESANVLDATAFTLGPVVLDGGHGDDILKAPLVQPTAGGPCTSLLAPNILIGGEGRNTLTGGQGFDMVKEKGDLDFSLADGLLTGTEHATGAAVITDEMTGIERARLTGGAGDNTLDASQFTGQKVVLEGGLGDDTLIGGVADDCAKAQGDVDFTLTDTQLVGLGTDTLVHIDKGALTGGVNDNILDASGFTNGPVTLEGCGGSNTLIGGLGLDSVREHGDLDFVLTDSLLIGQAGGVPAIRDTLSSIEQARILGGAGNNVLDASGFNGQFVALEGGPGDDTLIGGGAIDQARAVGNADFVLTDTRLTGLGTDTLNNIDQAALVGGGGSNVMDTTEFHGRAALWGEAGNDTLKGGMGDDLLSGGAGDDDLQGGAGDDTVLAIGDTDFVLGAAQLTGLGTDSLDSIETAHLVGGPGHNILDASGFTGHFVALEGCGGDDILTGGDTAIDQVRAVGDTDFLLTDSRLAGLGTDTLDGIDQALLVGGAGDNRMDAAAFTRGMVKLLGESGNDVLLGGAANDLLSGGYGDDELDGGAGKDRLAGGAGADAFVFGTVEGGADKVSDFQSGADHLRFLDGPAGLGIGNGDHAIDLGTEANAPGSFSSQAELVIVTSDIVGAITAHSAAVAIGSATEAYAVGDVRLFCVDNGTDSRLFLFHAGNEGPHVESAELTLVGTLYGAAQTALADYTFA